MKYIAMLLLVLSIRSEAQQFKVKANIGAAYCHINHLSTLGIELNPTLHVGDFNINNVYIKDIILSPNPKLGWGEGGHAMVGPTVGYVISKDWLWVDLTPMYGYQFYIWSQDSDKKKNNGWVSVYSLKIDGKESCSDYYMLLSYSSKMSWIGLGFNLYND